MILNVFVNIIRLFVFPTTYVTCITYGYSSAAVGTMVDEKKESGIPLLYLFEIVYNKDKHSWQW